MEGVHAIELNVYWSAKCGSYQFKQGNMLKCMVSYHCVYQSKRLVHSPLVHRIGVVAKVYLTNNNQTI